MTEGDDGGIVEYGFLDEQSDVYGSFGDAAMRDTGCFDEFEVLVHHQYPCFFGIKILHLGKHVVVDGKGRTQIRATSYLSRARRFPSSQAARMVIALAGPIPL